MKEIEKYTSQNRLAWDEIAEVRQQKMQAAEFFAKGGCTLSDEVLAVAGDVRGLSLCHLQCATGEDTLSWANRGATVTGIDLSPKQIELAKQKAAAAGLPVGFMASDIYALPTDLVAERFDILFTGGGAIVWLPDLQEWAKIIAQLLKPSGRLIIDEEHPIASCMEVQDGVVRIVEDYFGRKPEIFMGWSHFSGGENAREKKYEFTWPLGDVVTALAQAGLRIERLEERPSQEEWRFGDKLAEVARIPGEYVLVARKTKTRDKISLPIRNNAARRPPMNVNDNLEEFGDPPNYDIEEGERSSARIAFYCDLARAVGGPALEIACGSGLVAIPVAAQGLEVTGVDLARSMLEHARKKAEARGLDIRWVEADARSFELGAKYQLIFMTGNAFQAFLRREDQEALLASVRRHLSPEGVFAFETRNPSGHNLADQSEEEFDQSYVSVEGHRVSVSSTQIYDPIAQVIYWTSYRRWNDGVRDHTKKTRIACRFTHPQELKTLLDYNGFQILQQYGYWDKQPLAATSPSIISICKAR